MDTVIEYWEDGHYKTQDIRQESPETALSRIQSIGFNSELIDYTQSHKPQSKSPAK
jgi:hypothetical protein